MLVQELDRVQKSSKVPKSRDEMIARRTKASLTPPQSPKRPRKLARHKVQASPGSLVISSVAPSPQIPVDTGQAA